MEYVMLLNQYKCTTESMRCEINSIRQQQKETKN